MSKDVVRIEIPLDRLVEAMNPNAVRRIRATALEETMPPQRRPPEEALIHAGKLLSKALDRYEAGVGSRDERRALRALLAASEGVRSAIRNLNVKD